MYVPALAPERYCPDGQDGNEVNCVSVVVEHVADTYFPVGTVVVHVVHVPALPNVVAEPALNPERYCPVGQDGFGVSCVSDTPEHVYETYCPEGTVVVHGAHVPGFPAAPPPARPYPINPRSRFFKYCPDGHAPEMGANVASLVALHGVTTY